MPETEVVIFAESDGSSPLLEWMDRIPPKAQTKCLVRVERLEEMGHELRRPEAAHLRKGVYELRASLQGIHYRVLYFFHGQQAVLSHGLIKEGAVPSKEIELAIERKVRFQENPLAHTYEE